MVTLWVLVVVIEILGFHSQGWTMQILLLMSAMLASSVLGGWYYHQFKAVISVIASVLATLAMGEWWLRRTIYLQDTSNSIFRFDKELGWGFIPGSQATVINTDYRTEITINSEGFRDREHRPNNKTPNATQIIAVIGDSFTTNVGVPMTQVFTQQMDQRLGSQISVRNFGVNGYGQVQQLRLLPSILSTHHPDMVVLLFYVRNDLDDNAGVIDNRLPRFKRPWARLNAADKLEFMDDFLPPKQVLTSLSSRTLEHSIRSLALHRLAREVLPQTSLKSIPVEEQPPELRYCRISLSAREQNAQQVTQALLVEMAEQCRIAGTRFVMVIAPTRWQTHPERWQKLLERYGLNKTELSRTQPQENLIQMAKSTPFPVLDLLPYFEQYESQGEQLYYPSEQHWNTLGNQRVSEWISQWLRDIHPSQ